MIRLGYLDEEVGHRVTFKRIFKKDFEVIPLDDKDKVATIDKLLEYIEEEKLQALAVDYKLADGGWVSYNGDEVIRALHNQKRYFPVFLLTSYPTDALANMDDAFLVRDKSILSRGEQDDVAMKDKEKSLEFLKEQIKSAVASYKRIVEEKEERTRELEDKQTEGLTKKEEDELLELHMDLQAIDPKANRVSPADMQTESIKQLKELLAMSKEVLVELKKK